MLFCVKHSCWYSGAKCHMCLDGDKPYLRIRNEVADPHEWARFVRLGWTR